MGVMSRQPGTWLQERGPTWLQGTATPIHGTFRSPRGLAGSMHGSLRLERVGVEAGRLRVAGVFTGELLDADGTSIGVGSRRQVAPAMVPDDGDGGHVLIGPVQVDLLGLDVSIPAFAVDAEAGGEIAPIVRLPLPTSPAANGAGR